jgi:hypothetical protein
MEQAGQGLASIYAALAATAPLELAANVFTAAAIVLAGRNNVHTWWTGVLGTALFGLLFAQNRLYADVALQVFFVLTGIIGWWKWLRGQHGEPLPVTHAGANSLLWILPLGAGRDRGLWRHAAPLYERLRAFHRFRRARLQHHRPAADDAAARRELGLLAAREHHRHTAVLQPRAAPDRHPVCRFLDQRPRFLAHLAQTGRAAIP